MDLLLLPPLLLLLRLLFWVEMMKMMKMKMMKTMKTMMKMMMVHPAEFLRCCSLPLQLLLSPLPTAPLCRLTRPQEGRGSGKEGEAGGGRY